VIDRMQHGLVPPKPHVVHEVDGALTYEECVTRQGFDGAFSMLYHRRHPARHTGWRASKRGWAPPQAMPPDMLRRRHFVSPKLERGGRMLDRRIPLLFNRDLTVSIARPDQDDDLWFANNDGDELHFVHEGRGTVETMYGLLPFAAGDYVVLPRSTIHRWTWAEPGFVFTVEAHGFVDVPKNFRNEYGQLKMDAPYSHRDFGRPVWPEGGLDRAFADRPRTVVAKKGGAFTEYDWPHCPVDAVGWDGVVWPYTFAIEKYQPKTGLVHLPPTIHTTFVGARFVVCSFVPRVTDFHEKAIPCPYPHSSVDCDEVLFYVRGNFTSRKGVGPGSISLHPSGVVHGPHPGAYEKSIGTVRTDELAVMVDTFAPLESTTAAAAIEDPDYMQSWSASRDE
jgi:homogentisate 1,2-dioxygenase